MNRLLALARDDRVVLLGLGVAAVGLVSVMHAVLTHYRDEVEIKPHQPKTQYITQDTEDSLRLETLKTLLGHYNYAIRETAAKIVCDRAVNDGSTIDALLCGITRPDYEERMRSLKTLALITDQHSLQLLHTNKAYSALVRSLELCVDDAGGRQEKLADGFFDDYYLRDMAEKLCLMFVVQLLNKDDAGRLVRARFVERWLARQNWGAGDEERQRVFAEYMARRNNRITEICALLQETRAGREALEKAGLLPKGAAGAGAGEAGRRSRRFSFVLSISMAGEEGETAATAAAVAAAAADGGRLVETLVPRVREQSAEEQRLRRQHREAMVLNDGTRPLGRGDIIERDHDYIPD